MSDGHTAELVSFFAQQPRRVPVVRCICVVDACGGMVLAIYRYKADLLVVVDMEDFPERVSAASAGAGFGGGFERVPSHGPKVPGFRRPIFYDGLDGIRWPLVARCREHGAAEIARTTIEAALVEAKPLIKVHPRPLADM